jgi:multidrug efflux pump subunit AcrB
MVDIDLDRLHGYGLSPADVSSALNAQNLVLPTGTAKIGNLELPVLLNSSPGVVQELGALPVKQVNGAPVFLRDVANVRDGFAPQTNVVHADGHKAALLPILKAGGASTLDVVARIRAALPRVLSTLPKELEATLLFDQSVFVRAAVSGVVHEAVIAAVLTALMILLFVGSWRSTLVVMISIPLSILVSIIVLERLGHTLNIMTLGGMALAVGMLVDDATVEVENIHRNLGQGKRLYQAILDGAQQIALPALVSTLCIWIVFVPVGFIAGAARSLFVPLALAVVFAMLASYLLSRTLVPAMVQALLPAELAAHGRPPGRFARFHARFEHAFERLRDRYGRALAWALHHRGGVLAGFGALLAATLAIAPLLGTDFFPTVDAGLIRLHVRAPPSTRLEQSERIFAEVERKIRQVIPARELGSVLDDIGLPVSGINLALGDPSMISPADGEILMQLGRATAPPTSTSPRSAARCARPSRSCGCSSSGPTSRPRSSTSASPPRSTCSWWDRRRPAPRRWRWRASWSGASRPSRVRPTSTCSRWRTRPSSWSTSTGPAPSSWG